MNEQIEKINSYLSFRLGEEIFAAHVGKVLNILEMTKITKVPRAPEYMLGVINLRGTVLPVVDTRIKFGMVPTEFTTHTCILVLEIQMDNEVVNVGALVDGVLEVLEIEGAEILPPPNIGNKFKSEFITGMYKYDETQFAMLLDMDLIFNTTEIIDLKDFNTQNENN